MAFGALPPKMPSGQIYSGPDSLPMLAAATAWDGPGAELPPTATAGKSAIFRFAESWQGPPASAMSAATAPYLAWISAAAAQAGETVTRATAAVDRVIARLRQRPNSVRHWNVDQAGLDDPIAGLSKKPGVHAVNLSAGRQPRPQTGAPMRLPMALFGIAATIPAGPAPGDRGIDDPPAADNPAFRKSDLAVLRGPMTANLGFTTDGAAQFAAISASVYRPHQLSSDRANLNSPETFFE